MLPMLYENGYQIRMPSGGTSPASYLHPCSSVTLYIQLGPEGVIILKKQPTKPGFFPANYESQHFASVDKILHRYGKGRHGPPALNIYLRINSTLVIAVTCCPTSTQNSNQPWRPKTASTHSKTYRTRYLSMKACTILWRKADRSRRLHRRKRPMLYLCQ